MQIFKQQPFAIKLIYVGVLSFIIFLIATIPARLISSSLPEQLPIGLSNVQGTIWSGHADNLIINGAPTGTFSWSLKVFSLLTGKLAADISLQSPNVEAHGVVGTGFNKTLVLKHMKLKSDLPWLLNLAALPPAVIGQLEADIEYLSLSPSESNPLPNSDIKATLFWKKAGIEVPDAFSLGDFKLEVASNPSTASIIITVVDGSAALTARGDIEVQPSGDYNIDLKLTPASANLPDSISSTLEFIGRREADGQYSVQQKGHLRDYIDLPRLD